MGRLDGDQARTQAHETRQVRLLSLDTRPKPSHAAGPKGAGRPEFKSDPSPVTCARLTLQESGRQGPPTPPGPCPRQIIPPSAPTQSPLSILLRRTLGARRTALACPPRQPSWCRAQAPPGPPAHHPCRDAPACACCICAITPRKGFRPPPSVSNSSAAAQCERRATYARHARAARL